MSDSTSIDTTFSIARRVFFRLYYLAYKAQEHAIAAEKAGDTEKAEAAWSAFRSLQPQVRNSYLRMKRLDPEPLVPAVIDISESDVIIDSDMRWVFPDIIAGENEQGYGTWTDKE